MASAATFAVGAAIPLLLALVSPPAYITALVAVGTLLSLALLGGLAARAGGANVVIGAGRVMLWGALAMIATAVVGAIFGAVM
jgi:VIT1/CCC1 family predicted Fe2+/Mn2+ transporter